MTTVNKIKEATKAKKRNVYFLSGFDQVNGEKKIVVAPFGVNADSLNDVDFVINYWSTSEEAALESVLESIEEI